MSRFPASLVEFSIAIVKEPVPKQKVRLARQAGKAWQNSSIPIVKSDYNPIFPEMPGRPDRPELLSSHQMPKRRVGSKSGLIALVHSLVHIELNAIDMAFDFIARFHASPLPSSFLDGAVKVALEEAQHFEMINTCLEGLGASYGDLPAHGGLWDATKKTSHDLLARLAIVPLVLEARGLDVSPRMIQQVKSNGSHEIAKTMEIIYTDEITHVAFGARWFKFVCEQQKEDPQRKFRSLVKKYFRGPIKPPFNEEARTEAGLTPDFYRSLIKK